VLPELCVKDAISFQEKTREFPVIFLAELSPATMRFHNSPDRRMNPPKPFKLEG
jgi:hypothetical protein